MIWLGRQYEGVVLKPYEKGLGGELACVWDVLL